MHNSLRHGTTVVSRSHTGQVLFRNAFATITGEASTWRAAGSRSTRPLIPTTGPTVWRRHESTDTKEQEKPTERGSDSSTKSIAYQEKPTERWVGRSKESYEPLQGGSTQQELGAELRQALQQGQDPVEIFGDTEHTQWKHGLQLGGSNRKQRMVRQRLEHAAAATAVLGKYRGTAISSQYVQHADLSNELDDMLQEDGKEVAPFEHLEADPGLKRRKADMVRSKAKEQSPSWEKLSDFERRLYRNPYAKQLASPVRQCRVTGCRLPSDLLTSFSLKLDNENGSLWVVPANFYLQRHEWPYTLDFDPLGLQAAVPHIEALPAIESEGDEDAEVDAGEPLQAMHSDLLRSKYALQRLIRTYPRNRGIPGETTSESVRDARQAAIATTDPAEETSERAEERSGTSEETTGPNEGEIKSAEETSNLAEQGSKPARRNVGAHGHRMWAIPTPSALKAVGLTTEKPDNRRYLPSTWKERFGGLSRVNIREDMPEFILKLMRRRVARYLAFLVHTGQEVVLPFEHTDDKVFQTAAGLASMTVPNHIGKPVRKLSKAFVGGADPAAILWFGQSWGDQFPYTEDKLLAEVSENGPEDANRPRVPIYNLQQLLSKIEWDWLRTLKWVDDEGEHETAFTTRQVLVKESIWSFHSLNWLWRLQLATSGGNNGERSDTSESPRVKNQSRQRRHATA